MEFFLDAFTFQPQIEAAQNIIQSRLAALPSLNTVVGVAFAEGEKLRESLSGECPDVKKQKEAFDNGYYLSRAVEITAAVVGTLSTIAEGGIFALDWAAGEGTLGSLLSDSLGLSDMELSSPIQIGPLEAEDYLGLAKGDSSQFPLTGNDTFDQLASESDSFGHWAMKLNGRNIKITSQDLDLGLHAFFDDIEVSGGKITSGTLYIDEQQFRYIDMFHEYRHLRQFERLAQDTSFTGFTQKTLYQGLAKSQMLSDWFEVGAYDLELRLGQRFGFSEEYMATIATRRNYFWGRLNDKISRGGLSYLKNIWK